jgi:catechol 2,3-dioxygenase-like lactoylglutathione lyase family enzyme
VRHRGIAGGRFGRGTLRDWEITLDRLLLGFKITVMTAQLRAVHPVVMARDVEQSARFYQCLGFVVAFRDIPLNPKYVALRRDGVELHIQWADGEQWAYPTDRPAYRFLVNDVDAIYAEFVESGGIGVAPGQASPWARPSNTPWGTREFHVRDPSQNSLQFYRPL